MLITNFVISRVPKFISIYKPSHSATYSPSFVLKRIKKRNPNLKSWNSSNIVILLVSTFSLIGTVALLRRYVVAKNGNTHQ